MYVSYKKFPFKISYFTLISFWNDCIMYCDSIISDMYFLESFIMILLNLFLVI